MSGAEWAVLGLIAVLIPTVWCSWRIEGDRAAERRWRFDRATMPGPRYGARKVGGGLVWVGDRAVTLAEAQTYADEHEGYEVVTCDVSETPWRPVGRTLRHPANRDEADR